MFWRDFFYFSKGERRALIVLLFLITIAGILLILNDKPDPVTDYRDAGNAANTLAAASDSSGSSPHSSDFSGERSSVSSKTNRLPAGASSSSGRKENSAEKTPTVVNREKETVTERVMRITSHSRPSYSRTEKFEKGTLVELNTADTTVLKKVPGIGSTYARRIVGYRNLLGGYYSVVQLSEVYGIDEDRYNALAPWFTADPSLILKLPVNELSQDSLRRHPYINYNQAKIITQLRRQKGELTGWENLQLLNEFTDYDKMRLQHYLSFE
jgi:DNA uptake protein ComE-like DNA-binding protein